MANTPEGRVKKVVTRQLKELGAYYFFPMTGGYGKSGVPDIIACYRGRFFGIECKAGKNKPTALQEKNLRDISEAGGSSTVVNAFDT
jgi:Holliday junction resolvase